MSVPILAALRTLLIDLDGVVYRGDTALPGAAEAISALPGLGIRYGFVTNNATLTPGQYQAKLADLGISAGPDDVTTSAVATAEYLGSVAPSGGRVLAVGEAGLREALSGAGFSLVEADPDFVVVSLDRHATYERLAAACMAILNGARFIGTNADRAYPVEGGLWPGAGALLAVLQTATGVEPTIIGKPEPTLIRVALRRLDGDPSSAANVGDQLETDVAAGKAAGIATILVEGDLARPIGALEPDLRVRGLADLVDLLREARAGG